jgi:imidazole glycerol-phosphate synthase subunit HisH
MIGIVDTRGGNLLSICKAVEYLGFDVLLCERPEQLVDAERVILPGVGAFGEVMGRLVALGFADALHEVRSSGRAVMGICLGMQLMAERSFEHGEHAGLGWFAADVVRLEPTSPGNRVPHVGWHDTEHEPGSPLFAKVPQGADFYYVHSFHVVPSDPATLQAWFDYDGKTASSLRDGNVVATQFHPEKSQDHGMRVLENFLRWKV